jgi:predicted ester cyclase
VEGFVEVLQRFHAMFPDTVTRIDHIFGSGDFVAVRETVRGTDSGDGVNRPTPTGNTFDFTTHLHARIEDGKVAEIWEVFNVLALRNALHAVNR